MLEFRHEPHSLTAPLPNYVAVEPEQSDISMFIMCVKFTIEGGDFGRNVVGYICSLDNTTSMDLDSRRTSSVMY